MRGKDIHSQNARYTYTKMPAKITVVSIKLLIEGTTFVEQSYM